MWPVVLLWLTAAAPASPASELSQRAESGPRYAQEEALRRYLQGRSFEADGDVEGALSEYARALELDSASVTIRLRMSELAARDGRHDRSLALAEQVLARAPSLARAAWLRGAALYNLGRQSEALRALEQASDADPGKAEYARTWARVAEAMNRIDQVERAQSRAVRIDEDDGEAWFQLAAARARLGRFAAADSALARSLAIQPNRNGMYFLRGWIGESLGRVEAAIADYREHLRIYPQDAPTRRRLAGLLAARKRWGEALREARALVGSRPEDPDALTLLADIAFDAGKPEEARTALERMREIAPGDPDLVARSVVVLGRHGRQREAIQLADTYAASRLGRLEGTLLGARARAVLGQFDSAAVWARRAVNLAPDSLESRRLLARTLADARRFEESDAEWAEIVRRSPGQFEPWLELASARERRGDFAGAEQAIRSALQVDGENATALNFLGYMLADQNRQLPEAERLIRRAVEKDPENGAYLDSMGWVLFRLGRFDQARAWLERAIERLGSDPTVHEHLGDVYRELRLSDLARRHYRSALEIDQKNTRIQSKINGLR